MCGTCEGIMSSFCPACNTTPEKETVMILCPECLGEKKSDCCCAKIDEDTMICLECRDHADFHICDTCKNLGEVEDDN